MRPPNRGAAASGPHVGAGGGADLLTQLAAAAAAPGLPPDLRVEAVEALRCGLAALHGPAAGGGVELAAALRVRHGGCAGVRVRMRMRARVCGCASVRVRVRAGRITAVGG